ncbi:uncharacterized protein [Oscarella lobularis]
MRHRDRSSLTWWWMMCFHVVPFFPGSTAGPPYSYTVFQGVDAPGSDIEHANTKDIDALKSLCNNMTSCKGFNSNGWIKSDVSVRIPTKGCDVYLKVPTFGAPQAPLLPQPHTFTMGATTLSIGSKFGFVTDCQSVLLQQAFDRYQLLIFSHSYTSKSSSPLDTVYVVVHSPGEDLQLETDESYELNITASPPNSTLKAATIFGAMRGLETFSQLVTYNFAENAYEIHNASWFIEDEPRFQHRGLLIDTSRHFEPLRVIRNVLDSMSYAKLNVLHWHIVDTQSFPLQSLKYPKLWNGAYSSQERYSIEDVKDVVTYAKGRGIRVMPEFDMPGHAASWCIGYPDICPSSDCPQPLNPATNATFDLIEGFLKEMADVFGDNFIHLGGDEVNTKCWDKNPEIQAWLKMKNFTDDDAYKYFVSRAHQYAKNEQKTSVNWEEVFNHFGSTLEKNTVIHVWLNSKTAAKVVAAGYRCILSNSNRWYLPHLTVTWEQFYDNDPLASIEDAQQQKLMLGGEVCMWGETVDASDIQRTIWPRAAAAAERLWSLANVTDHDEMFLRLQSFRCLLTRRGVAAAPVENEEARSAPPGPGGCLSQ